MSDLDRRLKRIQMSDDMIEQATAKANAATRGTRMCPITERLSRSAYVMLKDGYQSSTLAKDALNEIEALRSRLKLLEREVRKAAMGGKDE